MNPFRYGRKTLVPSLCFRKGGDIYRHLANALATEIKSDNELHSAFLDFCKANGHNPEEHLPKYAEHLLDISAENTSTEVDNGEKTVYGRYTLEDGLFAAQVGLLGLPNVTKAIVDDLPSSSVALRAKTHFYVLDGSLHCTVELSGADRSEVYENSRWLRSILRSYGFGDIFTDTASEIEEDGIITVPTFAHRTLP